MDEFERAIRETSRATSDGDDAAAAMAAASTSESALRVSVNVELDSRSRAYDTTIGGGSGDEPPSATITLVVASAEVLTSVDVAISADVFLSRSYFKFGHGECGRMNERATATVATNLLVYMRLFSSQNAFYLAQLAGGGGTATLSAFVQSAPTRDARFTLAATTTSTTISGGKR